MPLDSQGIRHELDYWEGPNDTDFARALRRCRTCRKPADGHRGFSAGLPNSRVSGVTITGTQPLGTSTYGAVRGVIGPGEDVVGFAELPKSAQGRYERCASWDNTANKITPWRSASSQ